MKQNIVLALAVILSMLVGCNQDHFARQLIEHDTSYGKLGLTLTGSSEKLLAQKRIDAHRQVERPDETIIDVWVIKARSKNNASSDSTGTVLLIHGLMDSKSTYFGLANRMADKGYDVVLPDLRGHGNSTGKYVTYGAFEKQDIKAVMDELIAEDMINPNIYAFGVSMGGSVALQYAAIDPRCKGVMTVAATKDAHATTRRMMLFIAPTMSEKDFEKNLIRAGEIAGFNPAEASSIKAVETIDSPVLLVHGLLDATAPADSSEAIFEAANEPKQLIIVPWAGHLTVLLAREIWIADQIDNIAKTGLELKAQEPEGLKKISF